MKRMFKLSALLLMLAAPLTMTSCAKDSNITRASILKTVDGMNLYLTAIAKGNTSSNYVYLGDADAKGTTDKPNLRKYSEEIKEKANKQRPNCDVAYFPIAEEKEKDELKYFFSTLNPSISNETNRFKIVYIDSYADASANELTPTGVWIGRNGWIKNSGTSKKFIAGLAKTAEYRVSKMNIYSEKGDVIKESTNDSFQMAYRDYKDKTFSNFSSMYDFIKGEYDANRLPDYMFNDRNDKIVNYKSIYEYCALFALQNKSYFEGNRLTTFINTSCQNDGKKCFINNERATEIFGATKDLTKEYNDMPQAGKDIINNLKNQLGEGADFDPTLMRYGIYHVNDKSSGGNMSKVILWSVVGGSLVLIVAGLLIFRRVKTGRKLVSIRRALDVDIALDDPRMVTKRNVAQDLKVIREGLGLSLQDAAKQLHITYQSLEKDYESGLDFIPKRLRERFIEVYKLPKDFFEKAYSFEYKDKNKE